MQVAFPASAEQNMSVYGGFDKATPGRLHTYIRKIHNYLTKIEVAR